MEKIKQETIGQMLFRLSQVADTLTQEQIDACAWAMGGSGGGWTKEGIKTCLYEDMDKQDGIDYPYSVDSGYDERFYPKEVID